MNESFQDQGSIVNCFGCGANNETGLQLKSYWSGDKAIAEFLPEPFHCGGSTEVVYGGLIASLVDCHCCNLAVAYAYREEARLIGSKPKVLCVTAQLNVTYLKPTPIDQMITLSGRVLSIENRKIWIDCEVRSNKEVTSKGEVLIIRIN